MTPACGFFMQLQFDAPDEDATPVKKQGPLQRLSINVVLAATLAAAGILLSLAATRPLGRNR